MVEKYQLIGSYKDKHYEVIQWDVASKTLEDIKQFVKFPFSIKFNQAKNIITLRCSWGFFIVKPWDYIVKIDDYYLSVDCTFFNILFKKIKERQV